METKICGGKWGICGEEKSLGEFQRDGKYRKPYCKVCAAARRKELRDKYIARDAARKYRKIKKPCELAHTGGCSKRITKHHPDHACHEIIHWLCDRHHRAVDAGEINL